MLTKTSSFELQQRDTIGRRVTVKLYVAQMQKIQRHVPKAININAKLLGVCVHVSNSYGRKVR